MQPRELWPDDPIFIEIDPEDSSVAEGLDAAGYAKYLGVSRNARQIESIKALHPHLADKFTCSQRDRIVLHNNANVLVLSGTSRLRLWDYRSVRHARWVAWRVGFNLLSLLALCGCLCQMLLGRRYSRPRVLTLPLSDGGIQRFWVSRVLRQKLCHRGSLHFIPHRLGLAGLFRRFDEESLRYVVLRWFESLPEEEPTEDVDMLVGDSSLSGVLSILHSSPGIQPCDIYSETGLPRSDYCGAQYYPTTLARRILESPVRHKGLCNVPDPWNHFHSLAFHAVYHKGVRSGLPHADPRLQPKRKPSHGYAAILRDLADRLGIKVQIGLDELHRYLLENDWGLSPKALARLAAACPRNRWLTRLAKELGPTVHDQGLAVFALRREAVEQGFQEKMISMIRDSGFEILATKVLSPEEVEYAAPRTRGGTWENESRDNKGGPPAIAVVAYDPSPVAPNRKQRRRFPHRTNARIFIKETIRDAVQAELTPGQECNALHSSDHAAEAWHLIEMFAPELEDLIETRLEQLRQPADSPSALRRAA